MSVMKWCGAPAHLTLLLLIAGRAEPPAGTLRHRVHCMYGARCAWRRIEMNRPEEASMTSASRQLRFGIKTAPQHATYDALLRVWREADAEPIFEHAWLFDHFIPIGGNPVGPCFEGWTLLAAFAALTQRLRLGLMVTGNTYRHPAVLAKMAATVDVISGGRLDFGIGAGWNELEHTAYSMPPYAPGERIRRMGEACEVVRRMWTE